MDHNNGEDEDTPPSPLSNPNPNPNSSKHTRIMQNLKSATFARLAELHPNTTLSPSQITAIEHRLAQAFPSFQTPTHPTYASMIRKAIEELKEEGGSTEGSISDYILDKYCGLPWAHKCYLRRNLGKLCENGEIMSSVSNYYTIPGLITRPESKRRLLRGRKRKECEGVEGDLGGESPLGIEENEVCFEDEAQVRTRKVSKRRRSLLVLEDEEVGGKGCAEMEDDVIRNSGTPGIEGEEKRLLAVVGKESEVTTYGFGINDSGRDEVVGCNKDAEPQEGIVESTGEKLMHKEGQDEVRTEVLALDHHDPIVGKNEIFKEKMLRDECADGMGTEVGELGCETSEANLMLIPIEGEKKSALEEDTHIGTCSDVPEETLKKSAIMESDDRCFRTADLRIMPFKGDTAILATQKEKKPLVWEFAGTIVCGLPCEQVSGKPKRKQLVYYPKLRKSKRKAPCVLDNPQAASPVCQKLIQFGQNDVSPRTGPETKLDQTLQDPSIQHKLPLLIEHAQTSSPHGATPTIPVEEGSHKLESEKAKSYLEPSPSSGTQELMSMDNDNLDVQSNPVLRNCSDHTKLSEVFALARGLPVTENHAKTKPQRRKKELTATKKKQKQWQQHKSQAQKSDDLEAGSASAPESGSFLSFQREKGCADLKKRQEEQEPHDQGRCVLDGQHQELGENQQKTKDCGLCLSDNLDQTSKVGLREFSPSENQNGPEQADGQTASLGFEGTFDARFVSDNSPGQPLMFEPLSAKQDSPFEGDPMEDQQTKDESQVGVLDPDPHFSKLVEVKVQFSQERNKEAKRERRGRPRKQKEDTKDQINKQPKKDERGRLRKKKDETREVAAPLNGHDQLQEGRSEPLINKDGGGTPCVEKKETTGNVTAPVGLHYQKKDGKTHKLSPQKKLKKDGQGTSRKQGLVMKEPRKMRRGRSQKLEKGAKESEATMSYQEEEELNKKVGQQGTHCQVIFKRSELSGKSLLVGNQSNWDPREQKQHGKEDESHKQEKEQQRSDEVGELPHVPDEQPRKPQGQIDGMLCNEEQPTVNETSEQLEEQREDGGGQLSGLELVTEAVIDLPSQGEKESQLHDEKKEGLSRDSGKTPKQKSAKTKAIEVPLSSKTCLRSRTNH